jgi:hypothetical protein
LRVLELDSEESLRLLGGVPLGRVVFTQGGLPAIRPMNHLVDEDGVVVLAHESAALVSQIERSGSPGVVVAYEADDIDPVTHLGWSVVVTGFCRLVTDPLTLARCRGLPRPWADHRQNRVVRVAPTLVTGVRLVPDAGAG